MITKLTTHLKRAVLTLLVVISMASCVTQKDLVYMRDKKNALEIFKDAEVPDYKLKPNDELYITIKSLDDETTNVFAQSSQGGINATGMNPYGASLMSYLISSQGYLELPVIGMVKVADKTIPEVSSMLQDSLEFILSNPTVTVKLVNRYVSVLGEVRSPGHYSYSQEKLTIYNALGLAGDILDYGDRREVVLTRNEGGFSKRFILDLGKPETLALEGYYIRPNDMIYVKPMKKKFWDLRTFPYGFSIAVISTAILVYTALLSGN